VSTRRNRVLQPGHLPSTGLLLDYHS
jgi:hypothetical protein